MRNGQRSSGFWPNRPLTGAEVGMVVGVVAIIALCCLGTMVLGLFAPHPAPVQIPVYPMPSAS